MGFTCTIRGRRDKFFIADDYLRKYLDENGILDLNEIGHRYNGQVIGRHETKRNKKGEKIEVCHPIEIRRITLDVVMETEDGAEVKPVVQCSSIGGGRMTLTLDDNRFMWDTPKFGVVNYKDTVLFTYTSPARRWRRGFNRELLQHTDPLPLDTRVLRKYTNLPNISRSVLIKSLYDPLMLDFDEAFDKVWNLNRRAAAFSYKFFIANSLLNEDLVIGYKTHIVGRMDKDKTIYLRPESKFLLESLSEYTPCIVEER